MSERVNLDKCESKLDIQISTLMSLPDRASEWSSSIRPILWGEGGVWVEGRGRGVRGGRGGNCAFCRVVEYNIPRCGAKYKPTIFYSSAST